MKCIVCAGTSFETFLALEYYSVLKCRNCGLGITFPAPAIGELESFNRNFYNGEKCASLYTSRRAELEARYEGYLERIKTFVKGGRLLDVGANIGLFVKAAKLAGFNSVGIEPNASCSNYSWEKFGLDIRCSTLQEAAFPENSFEVVTLFDVLEHIPDPGVLLNEVWRVLSPGGLLVVQSPNLERVMAWLMKENWNWLLLPDHLYHFNPSALERLLENRGFKVKKIRTWEPSSDFTGNIYSRFPAGGFFGRVLRKLLWLSSIVLVPLLQRLWWKAGKGGLVEIYAMKI